jgi:hypothetical protein
MLSAMLAARFPRVDDLSFDDAGGGSGCSDVFVLALRLRPRPLLGLVRCAAYRLPRTAARRGRGRSSGSG